MTVLKQPCFARGGFEGKQVATNNSKHRAAVRDGVGGAQEPDGSVFHFFVTISDKDLQGEKTALLWHIISPLEL